MDRLVDLVLWFVVNAAWQVTLLAALAALLAIPMRRADPAHRPLLWVAALLLSALVPRLTTTAFEPTDPRRPPWENVRPAAEQSAVGAWGATGLPLRWPLGELLAGIFFVSLFVGTARLAFAWDRVRRLSRKASIAGKSQRLLDAFERCSARLGVTRVELRFGNIPGPLTVGWRRPLIILPAAFRDQSSDELTAALGHELAHVRRNDFGVNLVLEVMTLPIGFHPATAWLKRQLRDSRELACDQLVVDCLLDRRRYAESILRIAEGLPRAALGLGIADSGNLKERIQRLVVRSRLLDGSASRRRLAAGCLALFGTAVVLGGFALTPLRPTMPQHPRWPPPAPPPPPRAPAAFEGAKEPRGAPAARPQVRVQKMVQKIKKWDSLN